MQIRSDSSQASRSGNRATGQKVYGTFLLGETEFAVAMEALEEVIDEPGHYVPMPMAPSAMLGVSSLRGSALPVMEAGRLLEWSGEEKTTARRVAVLRLGETRVGVRFDQTREVLWVNEGEVQWLESDVTERRAIAGVIPAEGGKRLIQILDISALVKVAKMPRWTQSTGAAPTQARLRRARRQEKRLVSFRVAGTVLGIDSISTVRVITPGQGGGAKLQDSPISSEVCKQAILVGKTLVPVVRLREFLGWGEAADGPAQVLICRSATGQMVGFGIDGVDQLIPYQADDIRVVPVFSDYQDTLFRGCLLREDRDPLIVLHETELFSAPLIQEVLHGHARLVRQEQELTGTQCAGSGKKKTDILVFRIGSLFGIRIAEVLEILDARQDFVRLPQAPPALVGTFGLRSEPVGVVDPRKLFGFGGERKGENERILIFATEGKRIGMLVDCVESILHWAEGDEELPEVFFQDFHQRIGDGFEKGLGLTNGGGRKQPMVLLHARQVVEKLRGVLDHSPAAQEAA